MKRRGFLGAAAAGVAVVAWPTWINEAFGDAPACDSKGNRGREPPRGSLAQLAIVAAAFRRARDADKPLLVLVIPADDMRKRERGEAFGELLNHGSDVELAPLAGVEVVCATMAELKKLVPNAGVGEPLMVLVTATKVPAVARPIDAPLPEYPGFSFEGEWKERGRVEEKIAAQRIAVMAKLLRDALGSDDRRAPALAADVRKRLKDKPPTGTRWANSSGCGTRVEGVKENVMYACGMGHTPAKSQRFLYFFTLPDRL